MRYILERYKIPFLISLVVSIGIIAIRAEANIVNAILIFSFSIISMLAIDLDLLLYSYVLHPTESGSKKVKELVASKNWKAYIKLVSEYEYKVRESILRSAFFQLMLTVLIVYVVFTNSNMAVTGLVLGLNAQILYKQFLEYNKVGNIDHLFDFYNGRKDKKFYIMYYLVVGVLYVISFSSV